MKKHSLSLLVALLLLTLASGCQCIWFVPSGDAPDGELVPVEVPKERNLQGAVNDFATALIFAGMQENWMNLPVRSAPDAATRAVYARVQSRLKWRTPAPDEVDGYALKSIFHPSDRWEMIFTKDGKTVWRQSIQLKASPPLNP